jgi:hypothetical protein
VSGSLFYFYTPPTNGTYSVPERDIVIEGTILKPFHILPHPLIPESIQIPLSLWECAVIAPSAHTAFSKKTIAMQLSG